jgi:hypothetical protein
MVSRRLAKGKRPDGLATGVRTVSPTSADGCHTVFQGSGRTVWRTVENGGRIVCVTISANGSPEGLADRAVRRFAMTICRTVRQRSE